MYALIQRHKRIAAIVIAIASLSFLFWMFSVADIKQMFGLQRCVAVVGEECITLREYRYELMRYSRLMDDPELRDLVKRQVLYGMISREAFYQKARSLGLVASDREVVDAIKEDRGFHEDGRFSLKKYKETLERIGLTPEEYETQVKKFLTVQKLLRLIRSGVYVTPEEEEYRRRLLFTALSGKLYLLTPQRVKIAYQPSEEEMKRYYEQNRERFRRDTGKTYRLWKTEKKEEAYSIYTSLKKGELPEGGEPVKDTEPLPEEVRRELGRLSEKERYTITKSGGRYYVLYLEELSPDRIKPYEEVKEEIRAALREEKELELLEKKAHETAEKLAKGEKVDLKPILFENSETGELLRLFRIGEEELIRLVFSEEKVFGPYRTAGGYAVIYVESRSLSRQGGGEGIREALLSEKYDSLLDLYADSLVRSLGVKVNEDLIR